MKTFFKTVVFAIFILVCSFVESTAKGRDVVILLKDSTVIKGELLAVRDSVVVIYTRPLYNEMDIFHEYVRIEKLSGIENITASGNNAFIKSLWAGAVSIAGGIAYNINGPQVTTGPKYALFADTRPANSMGYVLMTAGPVISLIIGSVMNKPEITFSFYDERHEIALKQDTVRTWQWADGITELKKIARFEAEEPRHVHEIIDVLLKE